VSAAKIGIIYVPNFYSSAFQAGGAAAKTVTSDVRKLLEDPERGLKAAGVDAVLLDLRGNRGGILTEAIALPGLFVGPGPVLQVKNRAGQTHTYPSGAKAAVWEGPLVVAVNRNTVSGAEICAAAIQDYGRGLIVGDSRTYGDGTIQDVLDIGRQQVAKSDAPQLGALKYTSQQFFRVSGDSVQHDGVSADVVLPSLTDSQMIGEAYRLHALPFERIDRLNHATFGVISAADKAGLQSLSDKRREGSADFHRLADNIAHLKARLARKTFPLSEAKARQEQLPFENEQVLAGGPIFPDNFYNNELLSVTLDYLDLLASRGAAK
jgi:carboxyl-terminal processing protease